MRDHFAGIQIQLNAGLTHLKLSMKANLPESIASDRFSLIFDNITLGLNENSFEADFSLYPNPTNDGCIILKINHFGGEDVNIKIHKILGQIVYNMKQKVDNSVGFNIDVHGL